MSQACFARQLDMDPPQGYNPRPLHSGRVPYLLLLFPPFYLSYKCFLLILPLIGYRVLVSFRVTLSVVHVRVGFHFFFDNERALSLSLSLHPTKNQPPITSHRSSPLIPSRATGSKHQLCTHQSGAAQLQASTEPPTITSRTHAHTFLSRSSTFLLPINTRYI